MNPHTQIENSTLEELYQSLSEAWSDKNLNRITGKLIELYKHKNFGKIREISNHVSKYVLIEEEKDARCFSKLITLYHPDKGDATRKNLKNLFSRNDVPGLRRHAHIMLLDNIEDVPVSSSDVDIDYQPEYVYDTDFQTDTGYYTDDGYINAGYEGELDRTFYNAIKLRVYGDLNREFPTYYLEDVEDIELVDSNIEYLEGLEYCHQVVTLDLSGNLISDLTEIWELHRLEELYLSNNAIGYIDSLSNLMNLRILDISLNEIDDISPLFTLENLEYVNIFGNDINPDQVRVLESRGVIVVY